MKLQDERPSTTLVMCPSHITHKWAREVLLSIPRARAFLIEDMRNGGETTPETFLMLLSAYIDQINRYLQIQAESQNQI